MTAILVLLPTSATCLSIRLLDAQAPGGAPVWMNRCYPFGTREHDRSLAGAMDRMAAWAERHGWEVIDPLGAVMVRATVQRKAS